MRSSLTIHVCFLREPVFVGTNNPNMEETGSLENLIPSGKCHLELNRAFVRSHLVRLSTLVHPPRPGAGGSTAAPKVMEVQVG